MTTHRRQDHKQEEVNLRKTKEECTNGSHRIEICELHGVISIATWHARQAQEVHGEERDVERNQSPPEVNLAACFVVHHTRPLGAPVVEACKHGKQ